MNILNKHIKDLIPYEKNPRKNDGAVEYVAQSIKEFGFRVPIVIDNNNVVVCGHTRLKAAKQLNMETVPVTIVDDLTEEQVKAFRLADNKTAEKSSWEFGLLDEELRDIFNIDMEKFGFDFSIDAEPENERIRTDNSYNLQEYDSFRCEGYYEMPMLDPVDYIPSDLIGFNYMLTSKREDCGIHFFIDDYQFERIWNRPQEYINKMEKYECVLTPDFSLYMDMPMAMKIWNVYRSRLIGQMCQDHGLIVIPTASWAEENTYDWCFDGLPERGTLAVSTVGVMNNPEAYSTFCKGMNALIEKKKPKNIICYGMKPDYDFKDINVVYFKNHVTEKMKETE